MHVTAGDTYFEPEALDVRAGETVRFVVENQGQLRHDFTLGSPEVQKAHRAEMAERLANAAMEGHSDPNAVMLAPGETASVIWRFEKTDRFLFGCNIPGHFEAGMKGKITIQPAGM
ncbi:MAG: plastocyanin/azurin family copper-binding protein [Arhodomonas sp.]|nr:plastocyanin/azurin family copper-binding protein [Arhodomonas sp.]